ncbi:MAG TPA: hypothetical protein VI485_33050 [Vicinamibacterales bacterium]|nr:hypothetical protein [Vicinamibacterales bacterium]
MTTGSEQTMEAKQRIAVAAGAALLGAGLVLVMFVLPAEYGVDPLGTGARLGLVELGATAKQVEALEASATSTAQTTIVVGQGAPFKEETVNFTVPPGEGMEYKYRLDKGEALLYSWKATGSVNVEFHAEPDGGPRGYAQTYEKADRQAAASGTLTAPFAGIHGWYWENTTDQPVTVTLTSAGYYNLSHEFRSGAPTKNKTF